MHGIWDSRKDSKDEMEISMSNQMPISKQNGRKNNRISGSSSQVKNAETRARKTREKGKDYSHNWVKYVGKIKAP